MSEQIKRFERNLVHWFIAVDEWRVNLDDLVNSYSHPGAIVRCDGPPNEALVVHVQPLEPMLGCIAGFISEDE